MHRRRRGSRGCAESVPATSRFAYWGDGEPGARAPGHVGVRASGPRFVDSDVGKTLVPVPDLADNGRRGSPVPRSERI